jgi:ATPase subunit of ABC transporter with duplicated ATPase domains
VPLPSSFSTATVVAHRVSKERGPAQILTEVDLTVGPEHRLGVGEPNGVGKSTLLQILAGIELPDSGSVTLAPPESTIAYLAQEPEARGAETLSQLLARRFSGRRGGLVVVSHDREFLERIVTLLVDIDEASHRATTYGGGFRLSRGQGHGPPARRGGHGEYVAERDRLRSDAQGMTLWGHYTRHRGVESHDCKEIMWPFLAGSFMS